MDLKKRIKEVREEYETFYGLLKWQPTEEEKELGFLARVCFDESIPSKKVDSGISANITLYFILLVSLLKSKDSKERLTEYYKTLRDMKQHKGLVGG